MSWQRVRAWRDRLRTLDAATLDTGLSPEGAREALKVALDAISDEALEDAAALPLRPYATAHVVPASTVFTAPLEWCAVLLGRGSAVTIKRPRARSTLIDRMVEAADDLPLRATDARDVGGADLVVAMGSDATIEAIRPTLKPGARLAAHGSAWSLAWVTRDVSGLASDLALHDGRGCLSPAVVFSPIADAAARLADALREAQARWPVGEISAAEGSAIRARRALARVLGRSVDGDGWAVHVLPADRFVPAGLPRAPVLVPVRDLEEAIAAARRWPSRATIGTDDPEAAAAWQGLGASRVCALGQMQRPPMRRTHDGVDWVAAETGW